MEACINILSDRAETEMDLVLVTQVKCQLITHQLDDSSTLQPSLSGTTKSPSLILIHSLLRQLDGIKDATSPSFQSNGKSLSHTLVRLLIMAHRDDKTLPCPRRTCGEEASTVSAKISKPNNT